MVVPAPAMSLGELPPTMQLTSVALEFGPLATPPPPALDVLP